MTTKFDEYIELNSWLLKKGNLISKDNLGRKVFNVKENPDLIIKITNQYSEYKNAKKLLNKNNKHIVRIHFAKPYNEKYYLIVMDKVNTVLPQTINNILDDINRYSHQYNNNDDNKKFYYEALFDKNKIKNLIEKLSKKYPENEIIYVIKQLQKIVDECHQNKIYIESYNSKNIGCKNNRLILFDVGKININTQSINASINNIDDAVGGNDDDVSESLKEIKDYFKRSLEKVLKNIIRFISYISDAYNQLLSSNAHLNKKLMSFKIVENLSKITINDIKNQKLLNLIRRTGLLKDWNMYYIKTKQTGNNKNEEKIIIYITKDELKKGDICYGREIPIEDYITYSDYTKDNDNKIYENTEIFIVKNAKDNDEHYMDNYEKIEKEKTKQLEKDVNKAIKTGNILGRTATAPLGYENYPIAFKVIDANRVDLMKKLIDHCYDSEEVYMMINSVVDKDGWDATYGEKNTSYLPERTKSIEMARLIYKYIDAPDDKWIDNIKDDHVRNYYRNIEFDKLRKINKIIRDY